MTEDVSPEVKVINIADINYSEFVASLAKPGIDILQSLDPTEAHIWHMVTGFVGEIGELELAFTANRGRKNVREELGDLRFYFQAMCDDIGYDEPCGERIGHIRNTNTPLDEIAILRAIGYDLLDIYKRCFVYGDPLDTDRLVPCFLEIDIVLNELALKVNTTTEQVIKENKLKLLVRYEGIVYSRKGATGRADKKNGEI